MKKKMSIESAVRLIERDHGGCDQNTCTLSVALRHGYSIIAIDSWIGSGAASKEFDGTTQDWTFKELQEECALMTKELDHVQCGHCNAVLWLPEECGHFCDSCGNQIKVGA